MINNTTIQDTYFLGGLPFPVTAASSACGELGLPWERIAKSFDPIDPAKNSLGNYKEFVKDLVARIGMYTDIPVPADVQAIIDLAMEMAPSIAQVCKLQKFIKARDTLVVWGKIAEQAGIEVDLSEAFESADAAIDQAGGFSAWMEANHEQLQALSDLLLKELALTSIPKELGGLQNLEELHLGENQLVSIPRELAALRNLRGLYLTKNQFTSIPEWLGKLQKLDILHLSHNQLTSIPEGLGELQKLEILDLSYNQLTAIPEGLGELQKLLCLDLSDNQLTSIPEWLGKLQKLKLLDSSHNQLTSIPKELEELQNLRLLKLSHNQLTSIPEEICALPIAFEGNPLGSTLEKSEESAIQEEPVDVPIAEEGEEIDPISVEGRLSTEQSRDRLDIPAEEESRGYGMLRRLGMKLGIEAISVV